MRAQVGGDADATLRLQLARCRRGEHDAGRVEWSWSYDQNRDDFLLVCGACERTLSRFAPGELTTVSPSALHPTRWLTPHSEFLNEVQSRPVEWAGVPVPGLPRGAIYELRDPEGNLLQRFDQGAQGAWDESVWFDVFVVVGCELFQVGCSFDDKVNTHSVPRFAGASWNTVLKDLIPL